MFVKPYCRWTFKRARRQASAYAAARANQRFKVTLLCCSIVICCRLRSRGPLYPARPAVRREQQGPFGRNPAVFHSLHRSGWAASRPVESLPVFHLGMENAAQSGTRPLWQKALDSAYFGTFRAPRGRSLPPPHKVCRMNSPCPTHDKTRALRGFCRYMRGGRVPSALQRGNLVTPGDVSNRPTLAGLFSFPPNYFFYKALALAACSTRRSPAGVFNTSRRVATISGS